jgi:hypothetical protein
MRFPGIVSLLLLSAFIAAAYQAGWWMVMNTWDRQTWAIVTFVAAIAWSIRDDFGRGGGS